MKRIESGGRLGLEFFYMIHPRRSRAFLQTRPKSSQLLVRAYDQYLDAAIGIITNPSGELQNVRLTLDEPAETDPLNASADEKATGLGGMLI